MDIIVPTTSTSRDPAPGRLALVQELVNTLDVELDVDELADLASAGVVAARARTARRPTTRFDEGDLERARSFREALRALLDEHTDAAGADCRGRRARRRPRLPRCCVWRSEPTAPPCSSPPRRALTAPSRRCSRSSTVRRATGRWQRLKVCAEHSCRYAFYDSSRNRSGSWCTMAVCGNRAKARSYRERRRSSPAA